jgi:hypothetical protein
VICFDSGQRASVAKLKTLYEKKIKSKIPYLKVICQSEVDHPKKNQIIAKELDLQGKVSIRDVNFLSLSQIETKMQTMGYN